MKLQAKSRNNWGDLIRAVVYETLPYLGVACLWVAAWARSLESKVRMSLETHDHGSIVAADQPANSPGQPPVAELDQN